MHRSATATRLFVIAVALGIAVAALPAVVVWSFRDWFR